MSYIALKELVLEYAKRYGVSYEDAIDFIKEDLKAIKDDIAIGRSHHTGVFSATHKS